MNYSHEVEKMMCVKQGPNHGPAPIPEEGKWVKAKEIIGHLGICRTAWAGARRSRAPVS